MTFGRPLLKMTILYRKIFEPIMTRFSNNRQGSNPILAELPFCLLTHAYIRVRKKVSMKPNPTKHIGAYLVHIQWRCLYSSSGAWCTPRKLGINYNITLNLYPFSQVQFIIIKLAWGNLTPKAQFNVSRYWISELTLFSI